MDAEIWVCERELDAGVGVLHQAETSREFCERVCSGCVCRTDPPDHCNRLVELLRRVPSSLLRSKGGG